MTRWIETSRTITAPKLDGVEARSQSVSTPHQSTPKSTLKSLRSGITRSIICYGLAITLTALVCGSVWPGYLSVDSLAALREARNGIASNWFPPMVAYMQRLCDSIYPGCGLLFVAQVGLYLLSIADIFVASELTLFIAIPALLFLALCPAFLGPLLVVWKDVGMTAFLTAGTACVIRANKSNGAGKIWITASLLLWLIAATYRHNAITCVIVLIAFAAYEVCAGKLKRTAVVASAVIAVFAGCIWFLDTYRLPDLKPIPGASLIPCLYKFDLLGISAISNENLLPTQMYRQHAAFTVQDLKNDYFPDNEGKSYTQNTPEQKTLAYCLPPGDLAMRWRNAILTHPGAYLRHRWKVFKCFLGIGCRQPYYLTHATIEKNEFGIEFIPNFMTPQVMNYLLRTERLPIAFPWFYYILAVPLFFATWPCTPRTKVPLVLLISAFSLWLPWTIVAVSCEQRYHFWPMVAITVGCVLTGEAIWRKLSERTATAG